MMRYVSILGLLALLGIAWALSYHRRDIRPRILLWGLGLQVLFALIILPEDEWSLASVIPRSWGGFGEALRGLFSWVVFHPSFLGMVVFGLLLVAFILRPKDAGVTAAVTSAALFAAAGAGAGWVLSTFLPQALPWALGLTVVFLLLNGKLRLAPGGQRYGGALLIVLGVTLLISQGYTGKVIFDSLSTQVAAFLNLSDYGARFLFGNLADPQHFFVEPGTPWPGFGFQFAFKVLPTIIFFGGFMGVLYYLGVMQKVIEAMAGFMRWTMGTSGAETLSCSANIFVGQTEAPLLIKPFLSGMTRSELLTIMVGGFATIAGGVLAGYIAMGVPAGHLIAASVMSAPAALVIGKIIFPEKEHSQTAGDVEMPDIEVGGNAIEAAAGGITDGLKLAVNVGAMLVGFIALIAVVDVALNGLDALIDGRWLGAPYEAYGATGGLSPAVGEYRGVFPGSLQTLFGAVLGPLAWLMGVPWADHEAVGNLLGIKLSLNEFVAYGTLGTYIQGGVLSERAVIISTYALCGFANFSSIGIQIGGISAIAPERRGDLAKVGLKAMLGGAIASWITATIAGMILG